MRIHHLDCCTMCPAGGRHVINDAGFLVGHCLLLETERSGLVLVDTGIGLADVAQPSHRLGRGFVVGFRPKTDPAGTAIRQIERLGFSADDVRHIVLTHLDVDHAGGLGDFPEATVHVHADEHAAAMVRRTLNERSRYRSVQWQHRPRWATYRTGHGEPWFGFAAVHALPGLPEEIVAIPLPGHTRGHAAIAVRAGANWLLHAGDAYFHHSTVAGTRASVPLGLRAFERLVAIDHRRVAANHARLRDLVIAHPGEMRVFSAHDPDEFRSFVEP